MTVPSVVILGAGVMGASVAWHLARRGVRDLVLLDRAAGPGGGSTPKATGGFRAQYGTGVNVRLSLLSRAKLAAFREEVGGDAGYAPHGYLWLAGTDGELAALAAAQELQHDAGLAEAVIVAPDEVRRLNPALEPDGIVGAAWCPTDGFLSPRGMLEAYLAAAERLGARVRWNVAATGLDRGPGGRVSAVVAGGERIPAGAVVNALGAWAAPIMESAGLDLPVTPLRRQVAVTEPTDVLPADMPMTIFVSDGFHLRVRERRVLLLWPTPGVPNRPFDVAVESDWIRAVVAKARARLPALRRVAIDTAACWAGLYEMSPDKHAILGPAAGAPNLYLINGSSGHGVMHAPALGQLLAEIICDGRASTLDTAPLRPERFAEGRPNPVSELL